MVTDQVESQKLQPALLALPGVQFSDTAGSQVPGMGVRLLQGLVEFLEILPTDNALTAHLQGLGTGDGQRYVLHDPDGMGDVLTLEPIAAGNGLNQLAARIAQHQRQSVQLPADDHPPPADELEYLAGGLGLVGREHRLGMGYRRQALQHLARHPLGGRRRQDNAGVPFQLRQLIVEPVVFQIGHDRIVLAVVGGIRLFQLGNQGFHFVEHKALLQKMYL